MKRVLTFVLALALAVGASVPTVFASDTGYGQTDLIPLEDLDQETFDTYLKKFYSQDYPTYGVLDLIRDTFKGGLANASGLNDSAWSWALDLVDNASDLGTEVGLWLSGVKIDPNTGKVIYPDDYLTDYAKSLLNSQLLSSSGGALDINGHTWYATPWTDVSGYFISGSSSNQSALDDVIIYWSTFRSGSNTNDVWASWASGSCYLSIHTASGYFYNSLSSGYNLDGVSYKYKIGNMNYHPSGVSLSAQYNSAWDALNDFYGVGQISPGDSWNGSGYYSDHQDSFSINLPSLPSTNWGNLSKYYYTTYGDEIVEGDVDRYYYNIANNYAPYEVSYELPYWLINGSTEVLDFNYSLELPSADLYELPSEFSGGDSVWDSSFNMLGGFGAFILLGFSFGLVTLFFKD